MRTSDHSTSARKLDETTGVERRQQGLIHERVAALAMRSASSLAVSDGVHSLSYAELDRRANQLAHHLQQLGARPDTFVALCLHRSVQSIVAMLAVLKSGAAYVPMDPAYPAARIGGILEDAAPVCVVVEQALVGLIPGGVRRVVVDTPPYSSGQGLAEPPEVKVCGSHAAYAIFTSGSTGRPKGVVVEHANLLNLIDWCLDFYAIAPQERFSQLAGQGFDASVLEIWPVLAAGASLHLPPDEARLSAESLQRWLLDSRITAAFAPTLLAESLTQLPWPHDTPLRVLNTGGEALRRYPSVALPFAYYNLYGPTECTVAATAYRVPPLSDPERLPPVGRPIAQADVHVLDDALQPVLPGKVGEICIAGPGVARGYLHRAELTRERFVANPFGPGRLYRSGDLARWLPDGNLEFLGRNDQQVKLRGYRIELGEIEAALLSHPAVADALVRLGEWGGGPRLAAYVVAFGEAALPGPSEWRAYLEQRLPAYMIPSAFVPLAQIPFDTHGKRDTAALPDPAGFAGSDADWEAPGTEHERILAAHWQAVLKVAAVGRRDDFFVLGGHSLLAMQLRVRLQQMDRLDLCVRAIFEHRRLADMAAQLSPTRFLDEDITSVEDDGRPFALSTAQRGLWFLEQLNPDSAFYSIPLAVELAGPLDMSALRAAFEDVMARQDSLRTRVVDGPDGPVQEVDETAQLDFRIEDLGGDPAETRRHQALERMTAESARPFALAQAPLFRVRLYRLDDERHLLLMVFHHVVFDGHSYTVLGRALGERYAAHRRGVAGSSDTVAVHRGYRDVVRWESSHRRRVGYEQQTAYWSARLDGVPALEMPLDHPRAGRPDRSGDVARFVVDGETTAALEALGRTEQATLFMVLLTAFQILLHRHTGQTDFAVGSPSANRTRGEFDATIGLLISTLALRADLSGDPDVAECLRRTRRTVLDGLAHQELPFEEVVRCVAAARDPQRSPLFQAMMVLQPAASTQLSLDGLEISDACVHNGTSRFDLLLTFSQSGAGLDGVLEYDSALFDAASMRRLAAQIPCLLQRMAQTPQCPVAQLDLIPDTQRRLLLETWNGEARSYDLDHTLAHWMQRQAAGTPAATAVVFEGRELCYAEFDARATALAWRLRELGVGPGAFVGVFMERSLELVVALVGILKAGGAYVPLDPAYPADRVEFMARDAQFGVLLTQPALLQRLPSFAGIVETLAEAAQTSVHDAPAPFVCPARPDDPAYMIYTSGSTGRPKGVIVTHRGICNRLFWMQEYFRLDAQDRVLQKTPYSFDVSVWEFFWPLMTGAALVVAKPDGHRDSRYIAGVIRDEAITTLHFVPSMLQVFLQENGIEQLDSLKHVICSGEALPAPVAHRFQQRLNAGLHNLYGPTEASVDVSYWSCPPAWQGAVVPIGRPVANTQLYVMDADGRLMPPGVPGELCIGGVQVAAGYHDRAALTAEKFVRDPFDATGRSTLYRTGDRVRHAADGNILFLGRFDHQVKIRGQRIELGEIEVRLQEHPDVRDAAVLAVEDGPGEKRLVAYLVPARADAVTSESVRRFLGTRLPEHMVPAQYVLLETMPLSPNGKLDRKALPAPARPTTPAGCAVVAPRNPQEEILALIWCRVLDLPDVSIDDSFFDLGGDSILVLQVRNLAEAQDLAFPLDLMFRHPTIRTLVQALGEGAGSDRELPEPERFDGLDAATRRHLPPDAEDAFPATLLQAGMLFHSDLERELPVYHDVFRYEVAGAFDASRFARVLADLVRLHPVLRSSFALTAEGRYLQVIHAGGEIPLTVDDLRGRDAAHVAQAAQAWMAAEKQRPFDPAHAPLLRMHVQVLTGQTFSLGLSFHHAILDGWSVASLVTELLEGLGEAGEAGTVPPARGLGRYAALERRAQESAAGAAFWKAQLAGYRRPPLALTPPQARMDDVDAVDVPLPDVLLERLREVARDASVPLKTVLLAVHLVLMKSLSGQADVVTGLVSNGRPEVAGSERLLGLFLNVLPFRREVRGGSWLDFLRDVFAQERDVVAHRRYPLARMQQDLGGVALVEVVFNFVHFHVLNRLGEIRPTGFDGFEMTHFPLAVNAYVDPFGGRYRLRFVYQKQAFRAATVDRLAARYLQVLDQLARAPQADVAGAELLLPGEHEELDACNRTAAVRRSDVPLHRRIGACAASVPASLAVADGSGSLTYAQLDAQADALAQRLRRLGAGRGSLVAVCLQRSPPAIVALLAVFRAGAAYVPLDPAYPAARLAVILEDAAPVCVITQQALAGSMPAALPQVLLDAAPPAAEAPVSGDAAVAATDAAYVIFTSGSTGRPKGVVVEQANLLNLVDWYLDFYAIGASDRISHLAGQGFDASVFEIWPALAAGASLHLPPEEARLSAPALQQWLLQKRITVAFVPTVLGEALAELAWPADTALRVLNFGGEALRRHPSRPLPFTCYNAYGPTECTVATTVHALPRAPGSVGAPPIGRPVANVQVHLVDEALRRVPPGSPGELCIAGAGVARGYLGRPGLTRERFIDNPFGPGRLYRSGDLARWLPDGNLEFLGRNDQQVKLRGYRIEPGEIEAALLAHPAVAEAVVCVRTWSGEERLAAYLVPRDAAVGGSALREHLQQHLPAYMLPSAYLFLASLPLTANGKRDLAALPDPTGDLLSDLPWEAPRAGHEQTLAAHWIALLRVPRVGRQDDFFALGGHSLLAMQLVSRLRREQGIDLPVRAIFEHSTLARMAQRISHAAAAEQGVIARADRRRPIPLTSSQRGLWFLDQVEGAGAKAYLVPMAFRIRGSLNVAAIVCALREIVRRHEALRTVFRAERGEAVQHILEDAVAAVNVVDFSGLAPPQREPEALRHLQIAAGTGFDLASDLPFRASLLRLAAHEHLLLVTLHHIVSDGWSLGVLNRELQSLYEAYAAGGEIDAPPLAIQYADYAVWAGARAATPSFQRQLRYWQDRLDGLPARLDLPADFARPALPSYRGQSFAFAISRELTDSLKARCAERGATLFMGGLAAFAVFLGRLSGQDDVAIGTPSANRSRPEVEDLIGFFVNTLVLRVALDGAPGFGAVLERVRDAALGAYDHQDVPFETLVESLGVEVSAAHNPLFQVMFILQNPADTELRLADLDVVALKPQSPSAKFDLTLSLEECDAGLLAEFEYNTDLFAPATMERMAQRFLTLLQGLLRDPEAPVDTVVLLPAAERRQVLEDFNATAVDYPADRSVHELFREQARRSPDATALVFGESSVTYAELERRAGQLAAHLQNLGVGIDSRVGICVERSVEMVVGILGILEAGGAYLPIKPFTPAARIAYLLEDAQVSVLLTQDRLLSSLPAFPGTICSLDDPLPAPAGPPPAGRPAAGARDLAYVMHTSGSTGEPKGVMVEHRSVVRLVKGADYADFGGRQVFVSLAPLAFDASTFEIWGALLNGHSLVVAPPHDHSLDELAALLAKHRVTTLWLTAGLFHLMVDYRLDGLGGLSQLLAGGDVLSPPHVNRFRRAYPGIRLINGYGPTENTTFTCCFTLAGEVRGASVPIGVPIANTRVHILDRHMQPVPVGVRGELFAGGDGVARGYLNRPELTHGAFVADPFGAPPQARLYRTGDEARWLSDGRIEFLGRRDSQVKIRGFRIELGEIEAALCSHDEVQESVVLASGSGAADKRLVAYVVPAAASSSSLAAELRTLLRQRLPDYMVPASVIVLSALPLTANGKVDRAALPPPEDHADDGGFVAPGSRDEILLAQAWEEALQVRPIGITDNFFERGGHSLSAVKAVALASSALGIAVPVRLIFQYPTIEEMVRQLRADAPVQDAVGVVALRSRGRKAPLFCFHALFATALFYADIARQLADDQPVYALQAPGIYGEEEPQWTLDGLLRRHLASIRRIQPQGPYFLAGYCMGGVLALEAARRLREEGEEVALLALLDSFQAPRDVALPSRDDDALLRETILDLVARAGGDGPAVLAEIWPRPARERVVLAMQWARKAAVFPSDITDPDGFLPWMRTSAANATVYLEHAPGPYPGDVLFLRAAERGMDPMAGWAGTLVGNVALVDVPGNHSSMLEMPQAEVLAGVLGARLEAAQADLASGSGKPVADQV